MGLFKVIPDEAMRAITACNFPIKTIERAVIKGKGLDCFAFRGLLVNWDTLDTPTERAAVHAHIKACEKCKAWAKKHNVDWAKITHDEDSVVLP